MRITFTVHSDALDTLAVMGNYSEFRRVYSIIEKRTDFDANINVSVFETNIRIVGGLLAAHLVARRAGVEVKTIAQQACLIVHNLRWVQDGRVQALC